MQDYQLKSACGSSLTVKLKWPPLLSSPVGGRIVHQLFLSFLCSNVKGVFPSPTSELEGSAGWRTENNHGTYDFTINIF